MLGFGSISVAVMDSQGKLIMESILETKASGRGLASMAVATTMTPSCNHAATGVSV
jgi:hypothetical protein